MAYTVLEESSRLEALEKGPSLKSAALRMIREDCEGLRFDAKITREEKKTGKLQGNSIDPEMIPYNMQMDIDRLCLERALNRFLDSGTARDAFDVYFCYLEMFIGDYAKTRWMIELLSEFENNGSSLLMKHRDHYVHSVYVFALGLAIYRTNPEFRRVYRDFYRLDKTAAAHHFLRYWGMSSLFHDIGYPFELPFEQVASYFEVANTDRKERPFMAYNGLEDYVKLPEWLKRKIAALYGDNAIFGSSDELFAWDLSRKLGKKYCFTKENLLDILRRKPTHPEQFNHFMDHAYFSATVLFRKLYGELGCELTKAAVDALTAIILHNSLYKFSIGFYRDNDKRLEKKPFAPDDHPLAWLLMLCDELQCWDRVAYGRNSRRELHPMDCEFRFTSKGIRAVYAYDLKDQYKEAQFREDYADWEARKPVDDKTDPLYETRLKTWKKSKPRLKACSDMLVLRKGETCAFTKDIEDIVDTGISPLKVSVSWQARETGRKHTYLSETNFLHLYQFAVALHGRWLQNQEWDKAVGERRAIAWLTKNEDFFTEEFGKLSLEYKLSNINQAKSFDRILDRIGCFYTDQPVDYPLLEAFTEEEAAIIGPMEHSRWSREKLDMGWRYGEPETKSERETTRLHKDLIPPELVPDGTVTDEVLKQNYERIGRQEQDKDLVPLDTMLLLLRAFDGVRMYRLADPAAPEA